MARFVVLVEFRLRPGTGERFRELVLENARSSVRDEPGCRRFDVLLPNDPADPDLIRLYEIYDDADAFKDHLDTPHFARFKAATSDLIESTVVGTFDVLENAAA